MVAASWVAQIKAHSRYHPFPRPLDVLCTQSLLPEEIHCRSEPQFCKDAGQHAGSAGCAKSNLMTLGFTKHRRGTPGIPRYPSTTGSPLYPRLGCRQTADHVCPISANDGETSEDGSTREANAYARVRERCPRCS